MPPTVGNGNGQIKRDVLNGDAHGDGEQLIRQGFALIGRAWGLSRS